MTKPCFLLLSKRIMYDSWSMFTILTVSLMFSFYTLRVIIKILTKISISTRLILIKKWLKVKWINILDIKKPPMRWFFYCAEINQQPVILVNYLVAFKVCALAVASA
jgi:hypothetical protein